MQLLRAGGHLRGICFLLVILPFGAFGALPASQRAEIYSENLTAERDTSAGVLTETRLRLFLLPEQKYIRPFLGGYHNSFSQGPTVGALGLIGTPANLQIVVEGRQVYQDDRPLENELRYGLVGGTWNSFTRYHFLESYFESFVIPRLHPAPVTTLFLRWGIRSELARGLYLDGFIQPWGRQSPSLDLGNEGIEIRPGARITWWFNEFAVAAYVQYREKITPRFEPQWEGMLVFQGLWP